MYITTYPAMTEWLKDKHRIGFLGNNPTLESMDIWTIELYETNNGEYSFLITTDSDESSLAFDFIREDAKVTKE